MLEDVRELSVPAERDNARTALPPGGGIALIGALMMVIGACAPWIGGFFGATTGIDLGGDGWLVMAAAVLGLAPLVLRLVSPTLTGAWVVSFALVSAYVCWTHYLQAREDGLDVVWGLELSGIGSALLALGGLRVLLDRS
jgi:hypothetical protein